jgi:hypothetical protein
MQEPLRNFAYTIGNPKAGQLGADMMKIFEDLAKSLRKLMREAFLLLKRI